MEKATKLISKIVAIALMVLSILGVAGGVYLAIAGAFSAIIMSLIFTVAELVVAVMLLGAIKDIASTKFLVLIIVASVLLLLDVILGGAAGLAGTFITLLLSSLAIAKIFVIISIVLLVAAIAAMILKIVMVCKK